MGVSLAYVVLGVVVLIVAKLVNDWLTPFKIDRQLTEKDNPAVGLALTGYFAGVVIIFLGASIGPDVSALSTTELLQMIGIDFLWSMGGILALNVGRVVVDRLVLTKFSTVKEIIEDRNVGTGAVEAGCYIATALVVAGAIHGEGGNLLTAIVFFLLGQLVLVLFSRFYQMITRYDIHEEIEKDNVAAGVALGVSMIAIGILLLRATMGDFIGWAENMQSFAVNAGIGFVLLMILRRVTDALLLPGTTIAHEIAHDQNLNAAWVEGIVSVGLATVIFFMI
jgi:uncharacterized membrane protein YjfL (UPF0719 family)